MRSIAVGLTMACFAVASCGDDAGGRVEDTGSARPTTPSALSFSDPQGDVRPIGGKKRGDIVSANVEHNATDVIVSMEFARLEVPKNGISYRVAPNIHTETGSWWAAWEEDVFGQPPLTLYKQSYNNRVRCDGFRHSVDYGNGVVTLSIPRDCLQNPSWVRVSLFVGTWIRGDFTRDHVRHDGPKLEGERYSKRIFAP